MRTKRQIGFAAVFSVVIALSNFSRGAAQSVIHLPVVAAQNLTCLLPQGSAPEPQMDGQGSVSLLRSTGGEIVPVGNQLDDMGQYYSQAAPSLSSAVVISNPPLRGESTP